MQVNQSGPTCAVLSLRSRENSVSICVKTRSNTNLVASKRPKFLLTSLERLLVISFVVKGAGAVMLLFRWENTTRVTAVYVIM